MKTNIFSPKTYREGLRQLVVPGGVSSGIVLLLTLVCLLLSRGQHEVGLVAMMIYAFVAPLLLVFSVFSFLFKRSASDLMHSLPDSRVCQYLSYSLAILSWLFATIALLAISTGSAALISGSSPNGFFSIVGASVSIATLVTACCLIGVAVTGRRFSSFVVAGLVLFMPRFLNVAFLLIIEGTSPILFSMEFGPLFSPMLNLPASLALWLVDMFVGFSLTSISPNLTAGIIYTLALGLVYIGLGAVIYHFRRSETAERGASSKAFQHLFRCLITLPLLMVVGAGVVFWANDSFSYSSDLPSALLVILVLAFIVYVVYELITVRKWRSVAKSLWLFPILVGISLCMSFGAESFGRYQTEKLPPTEDIKSVQVHYSPQTITGDYNYQNYNKTLIGELELTDTELMGLMQKNLGSTIELVRGRAPDYAHAEVPVRINLKNGHSLARVVYVAAADYQRVEDILSRMPQYVAAQTALPSLDEIHSVDLSEYVDHTTTDMNAIWTMFAAEFETLTPEQQRILIQNDGVYVAQVAETGDATYTQLIQPAAPSSEMSIRVSGSLGHVSFFNAYPLGALTPKTTNYVLSLMDSQARRKEIKELALELSMRPYTDLFIEISPLSNHHALLDSAALPADIASLSSSFHALHYFQDADNSQEERAIVDEILDLLINQSQAPAQIEQPLVKFMIDAYFPTEDSYSTPAYFLNNRYINLSPEHYTRLLTLIAQLEAMQ